MAIKENTQVNKMIVKIQAPLTSKYGEEIAAQMTRTFTSELLEIAETNGAILAKSKIAKHTNNFMSEHNLA